LLLRLVLEAVKQVVDCFITYISMLLKPKSWIGLHVF